MTEAQERHKILKRHAIAVAALIVAVFGAYYPLLNGDFVWDDLVHVPFNRVLVTPDGLFRIWTIQGFQQYLPIQLTTYWIEVRLWGFNPLPFHIDNLILHILNGILIWRVLLRLEFPCPYLAAAIFLLHPVNTETAGYITERRNLLAAMFYLSALLCWFNFEDADPIAQNSSRRRWYFAALGMFVLALLSKTVSCSLPVILLLLCWMRGRKLSARYVMGTLPFFAVGLPFGLLTTFMERSLIGASGYEWNFSLAERFLICGRALWFYAGKIAWPHPLMFFYPRWKLDTHDWTQWCWVVAAVGLIVALFPLTRRFGRRPAAALLFFGITLFPALGFSNVYPQRFSFVADHFQYLASLGIILLLLGAAHCLCGLMRIPPIARRAAALVVLLTCGVLLWQHAHAFQSDDALYKDVLSKNDSCWLAHSNLAAGLFNHGQIDEAIPHYEKAWQYGPQDIGVANSLASAYRQKGRLDEARKLLEYALQISPAFEMVRRGSHSPPASVYDRIAWIFTHTLAPEALREGFLPVYQRYRVQYTISILTQLAELDWESGNKDAAKGRWDLAISLNPKNQEPYIARGLAFDRSGDLAAALSEFRHAADLPDRTGEPMFRVGAVLVRTGKLQEAIDAWHQALADDPHHAQTAFALGEIALKTNQPDEAERLLRLGLKERPGDFTQNMKLAGLLRSRGKDQEAAALENKMREIYPDRFPVR
jgi:tetratricopeptide (TPR) repeat protein